MKKLLTILFIFISSLCLAQPPIDTTDVNLFLWLSPDTAIYDVNGDPCDVGDDVYEWHDISGNGYIFENGVNNKRPEFDTIDGKNYIEFSPGNFLQNLDIDTILNGLTEFTIYIVIKSDDINTDQGFMDSELPDGGDDNICLRYDSWGANTGRDDCLKTGMVGNNSNHQVESQANTQTTNRQVLTLAWRQNERLFLFIDGVISDSSNWTFNSTISGCDRIIIGKGPKDGNLNQNKGWDGKIGDVVFYNRRHTNDSIQDLSDALPVELIDFTYTVTDNVNLYWSTASEINNDYFEIEKSTDGINFEHIGGVNGNGNSNSIIDYNYIDKNPLNGISYYRLKQVDFDGKFEYSKIIAVEYEKQFSFNVYPNPINSGGILSLEFANTEQKEVLVVVNDIYGRELYTKILITHQNGFVVACDCMDRLPSGTYIIMATSQNNIYKKKLVIR